MENGLSITINWGNVKEYDDHFISYLLFLEGKSVSLISQIRNLSKEEVDQQIIESKVKMKQSKKTQDFSQVFMVLLASTKEERLNFLLQSDGLVKEELMKYMVIRIPTIENAEDLMIALWLAGQLKDKRLLPAIHQESNHKHGGVRRMVCSALGKIQDRSSLDVLHRALQDGKPQVRQYAAKSLARIGNEKTVTRLKALLKNPNETEYVQRAYDNTIKEIQERLKRG
ncbi:PBS lyase HEAT domain protein repeat-containing protein [Alkaliphilus metalliredigens QYMF]|uniref:PBS lyase HEAT domain protein repeat-containing protein n=1 Tax=Alkaliphilus metalliredigens (strain QYMF) TaxID=293826 RepID=A6TQB6_ALKMQ|nr:HEAT repeat domain-containing protein [Alkaliphilus metalliredigens]ABR48384.1 PBS lyase HEAT domain protein repeat-containing protein [Alkaliphilus metalliredigens QYMF]